jgi:hypothetical protein
MKIGEILTPLHEAAAEPYPVTKIHDHSWQFDTETDTITVLLDTGLSDGLRLIQPSFTGSRVYSVTGFAGPNANRIVWTVVSIVSEIRNYDILIFSPSDESQRSLDRKISLYGRLLIILRRIGKIHRIGQFDNSGIKLFWALPPDSGAAKLSDAEIRDTIERIPELK